MNFSIRVDEATTWETDFVLTVINDFAEEVRNFLRHKSYGDKIEAIYPILVARSEEYRQRIKQHPEQTDVFRPTKFNRSLKMLMFIVEIDREEIYNKDKSIHYNIAAKAVLTGLNNATKYSKVRLILKN